MNDRIHSALLQAGLGTSPLATLDHEQAFFALFPDELVYQEGALLSRVPLRDVTRIHSDREGMLRVETAGRTAVTASLLGYDPGRVQRFFQTVRDSTARAKQLPVAPLATPKSVTPPASATTPAPTTPHFQPAPMPKVQPISTPPAPVTAAESAPPATPKPAEATPPPAAAAPAPAVSPAPRSIAPEPISTPVSIPARPEPVVISSAPSLTEAPAAPKPTPAPRTIRIGNTAPSAASELEEASVRPAVSAPAPLPARLNGPAEALLDHADAVQGFGRTLRLLAVVLGLAAVALAVLQYLNGNALSAIWTVLTGGVGTVALLAFAQALGLLASVAQELHAGRERG
ncbi:hypothetical protein [Deinococcus sonorensis]|uniref:GRAM domain-containing protein n=2 Tax=Deinococcus sonorensis TaxID=309891 RepID=A0AAU7UAU4_9DEIO